MSSKQATEGRRASEEEARRRAAFLDRDGVINVDHGFTHRPEDLTLTATAAEGIRMLNDAGYLVLVVTNQSGIARGFFDEAAVERFHAHMQQELARHGARIDGFYHCPYHPDGTVAAFAREHVDRKPQPGMLLRAIHDWNVERVGSFMIGDRETDAQSAAAAGLPCKLIEADTGDLAQAVREMIG